MRLGVLIPAGIIAPCGLIVYGLTAQHQLHWVGYFAGVVMCDWGSYFFFTFTLAYAIDSCEYLRRHISPFMNSLTVHRYCEHLRDANSHVRGQATY